MSATQNAALIAALAEALGVEITKAAPARKTKAARKVVEAKGTKATCACGSPKASTAPGAKYCARHVEQAEKAYALGIEAYRAWKSAVRRGDLTAANALVGEVGMDDDIQGALAAALGL